MHCIHLLAMLFSRHPAHGSDPLQSNHHALLRPPQTTLLAPIGSTIAQWKTCIAALADKQQIPKVYIITLNPQNPLCFEVCKAWST